MRPPERTSHEGRHCHRWRGTHAGRRIQRGICNHARPRARQGRDQGGDRPRRRRAVARLRSDPGPDLAGRTGPGPGPPGLDQCRHAGRSAGLERQPALRLGLAGGRARLSGHRQRRFGDCGRRRPGIDERGPALRLSARRREDGQLRDGRHHDQGRPVGCLQRLSHGQHGRECRAAVADHPCAAGRVRRQFAEQGGGRAKGRASSRTRSCR